MALANYTQLQAAIASWLDRDDLTAAIPDFITLAEARFNRELRVREMITRKQALSDKQYVQLPADWIEAKNIQIGINPLTYKTVDELDQLRTQPLVGAPRYYTILGSTLELLPTPSDDVQIEMAYYKTIPAVASSNTNWLLTKAPDLYLYASLLQAAPFLDNDERAAMWEAFTTKTVEALNVEASRAAVSGSPLLKSRRTFG
jgi:hypothetical protein